MATKTDDLLIRLKVDGQGNVSAALADVGEQVEGVGTKAEKSQLSASKLKGAIAGIIGAQSLRMLFTANVEYQRLGAILQTTEGSAEAASKRFDQLRDFAKETPFQLNEVVQAFVTLKNLGIDPSAEALTAYGNMASAMGKDLQQVAEAVADASVGEFERLKEFGIKASKQGEEIRFSFRGTETVVQNSSENIQEYLRSIGQTDFAGAMAVQMDTLGGKVSNLQDGFFNLLVSLGEYGASGVFSQILTNTTLLINDLADAINRYNGEERAVKNAAIEDLNAELLELDGQYAALSDRLSKPVEPTFLESLSVFMGGAKTDAEELEKQLKAVADRIRELETKRRTANAELLDLPDPPKPQKTAATTATSTAAIKEQEKAQKAAEDLVKALQEQIDTYGMTRDEMVLYQAEAIATATTDEALAAEVRGVAKALAEKIKAEKLATDEEEKHQEELKRSAEEAQALADAHAGMIEALRIIDPLRAREIERLDLQASITDKLNEAQARGLISQEELKQYLADLPELLRQAELGLLSLADQMEIGIDGLGEAFASIIDADDFKDGLDSLLDYFHDWLLGMGDEAAKNAIRIIFEGTSGQDGIKDLLKGVLEKAGINSNGLNSEDTAIAGGAAYLGGSLIGKLAGGSKNTGSYAATGATIGAAFGPWGAAIGAVVGVIAGLLTGKKDPRLRIGGRADSPTSQEYDTDLGGFYIQASSRIGDASDPDSAAHKIVEGIREFDKAVAVLLTNDERRLAELALEQFQKLYVGKDISGEQLIQDRLNVIVNAVMPQYARFIKGLGDVKAQFEGFAAIRGMQEFADGIEDLKDSLATDDITQFKLQLRQAREAETQALDLFHSALESMDPAAIAAGAEEAAQATIRRYQAEVQMVQQIVGLLFVGAATARRFTLDMDSRIASLSGDFTALFATLESQLTTLRAGVLDAPDNETALASLGEFIGTMDRWLTESRSAVERWLSQELSALDQEQSGIYEAAAARQERYEAQRQAAIDKQTEALEKQLGLAESWVEVLNQVEALIDRLSTSSANPLSAPGRLNLLGDRITAAQAALGRASPDEKPEIAQKLVDLLQERLSLAADIYQRPSNEYVALYNQTMAQLNQLKGTAAAGSASMEVLQQKLIDLQAEANDISSQQFRLTGSEQARLQAIDARREELQEEANAKLDAIDARAREAYEWAKTEGERLQAERQAELTALLYEITGGLEPNVFIAQQQGRAADLLEEIRDSLNLFLEEISTGTGTGAGTGGGAGPGAGAGGGNPYLPPYWDPIYGPRPKFENMPGQTVHVAVAPTVTVNGGDPEQVRKAVEEGTRAAVVRMMPVIKRELKVA